jgi:hypothetical protein
MSRSSPNSSGFRSLRAVLTALLTAALLTVTGAAVAGGDLYANVASWQFVKRESGKVNYYTVVNDPALPYIHAKYEPPFETAVLGYAVPEDSRHAYHHLTWTWRAITLPRGGNECAHGVEDSAAVLYVTWRNGLRWYTIKYVWSAVGTKGAICDKRRNPFVAQDTVILESGDPLNAWRTESLDLDAEFRAHFGDADTKVPDMLGLGIMTDGDQTQSVSSADYAGFVLSP